MVKMLLHNLDPNTKNDGGETLLMMAAKCGHLDIVKMLVEDYGADPTAVAHGGANVVNAAVFGGFERTLKYVLTLPVPSSCVHVHCRAG